MNAKYLTALSLAFLSTSLYAQTEEISVSVPRDSIYLSDPCVLADAKSHTYYMTGTGGKLWKSTDLELWEGPYTVAQTNPKSWMGEHPQIWAAELHEYNGKFYYFATFTNNDIIIDHNSNGEIPRRASHILVSNSPEGPYAPISKDDYLPEKLPTLDGTFWVDADNKPYMVYCGEWLANQNGTVEKIELAPDLSKSVGKSQILFRASDSPWSREIINGKMSFNRVTDGPWLFRTGSGRLGMIWTSWVLNKYTMGVAYSLSGTLDGPWKQEVDPIASENYGHGMIFTDFEGRTILSMHSHSEENGRYIRRPTFWLVDISGDKLRIIRKL